MKIQSYHSAERALTAASETLVSIISASKSQPFHIALSGGTSIYQLFHLWVSKYKESIPWSRLRFYWVNEACVPPSSPDSHYGNAEKILFIPLGIPNANIHRIFGEEVPEMEAKRYSEIIKWELPGCSPLPRFDCCILELGGHGEIASISSDETELITNHNLYAVTRHPFNAHTHITMTGTTLLKSRNLLVTAVGSEKHDIIKHLVTGDSETPAAQLLKRSPKATIFTDYPIEK